MQVLNFNFFLSQSFHCYSHLFVTFRRALAMFNYEERSKRENKILSDFREMIHQKIGNKKWFLRYNLFSTPPLAEELFSAGWKGLKTPRITLELWLKKLFQMDLEQTDGRWNCCIADRSTLLEGFFSNLLTNINKDFICLKIPRVSSVLVWHFQLDLEQATR